MSARQIAWVRVLVEGVVIVGSILLALAADAWWDTRKATQLEADALSALSEEVAANQATLRQDRETIRADLDRLNRFLDSEPEGVGGTAPDSVALWARALSLPTTFDPQMGAASLLSHLAALSREGLEVRALVSEWVTQVEDAAEEKEGIRARTQEVQELLAPYAIRASRGREGIASRIASLGPPVLAELRADSVLAVAVLRKTTIQEIYFRELTTLGGLLDSLAARL